MYLVNCHRNPHRNPMLWGKRIVNHSQLDENAQLGQTQLKPSQDPARDPLHVYTHRFSVFVPGWLERPERAKARRDIETLLEEERPTHAKGRIAFVHPRMRIGVQAMIGYDSVVGVYPQGFRLGEMPLGQATVLAGESGDRQGLVIGKRSRIGSSSKLN